VDDKGELGVATFVVGNDVKQYIQKQINTLSLSGDNTDASLVFNHGIRDVDISPHLNKILRIRNARDGIHVISQKEYRQLSSRNPPILQTDDIPFHITDDHTNIGFDFDGILHHCVHEPPDINGQYHPTTRTAADLRTRQCIHTPMFTLLSQILQNKTKRAYVISHNTELGAPGIQTFLSKFGIDPVHMTIIAKNGNKSVQLKENNITLFFDDSTCVLQEILNTYPECVLKLYHHTKGLYDYKGSHNITPSIVFPLYHCRALGNTPLFTVSTTTPDENVIGILYKWGNSTSHICKLMKVDKPPCPGKVSVMSWNMKYNGTRLKMKDGLQKHSQHNDIIATQELNPYKYKYASSIPSQITYTLRDVFSPIGSWGHVYFGTGRVTGSIAKPDWQQSDTAAVWWNTTIWRGDPDYPISRHNNGMYQKGAGKNNGLLRENGTYDSRGCVGVRLENIGPIPNNSLRARKIIVVSMHTGHSNNNDSFDPAIISTVDTLRIIFDALDAPTVDNIIIMGDFNEMNPSTHIFPYFKHKYDCTMGINHKPTIPAHAKIADYILHMTPYTGHIYNFDTNVGYHEREKNTDEVSWGSDHSQIYATIQLGRI